MGRVLGLDVGDATIGVAVSDPMMIMAQGVKTIFRKGFKKDMADLQMIIDEYEVEKVVIGLPKNMNNTIGPQGEKVIKFSEKFGKRFRDIEIIFIDERLTTVSAERTLIGGDVRREKRKELIDKVAATYILQSYLDKERG